MLFTFPMLVASLIVAPPLIAADEAGGHVGKEVTVEFAVASSKLLESGQFCFLNSKKGFSDKDNFTAAIRSEVIEKLAAKGIKDPASHFRGKTIRVTGKVSLYQDRPQIVVIKPEQVVEVVKIE